MYLDTEERRRFAQQSHEYLIEQLQFEGQQQITTASARLVLTLNHPVKELVWCYSQSSTTGALMWNFTSNAATSNAVVLESNTNNIQAAAFGNAYTLTSIAQGTGVPMLLTGSLNASSSGAKLPSKCQWVEEGTPSATVSCGPLDSFKLILNGQDRFKEQSGKFFNQMQPFMHHTGTPYPGIYCYSFALKPEEHQPTGTCNFSRIDKATLQLTVSVNTVRNGRTAQVRVYAVNYNVLRVMSGMGGLAYSN